MLEPFDNTTYNNTLTYFIDGQNIFPAIMDLLDSAEKSIYLETFLFNDDEAGNAITDKLVEKAKAGCDVKVLMSDKGMQVDDSFAMFDKMIKNNVKVSTTFPLAKEIKDVIGEIEWIKKEVEDLKEDIFEFRFDEVINNQLIEQAEARFEKARKKIDKKRWFEGIFFGKLARRKKKILRSLRFYDHRKIFVVDNKKAIIGGMNIGNDYMFQGKPSILGYFHDIGVLLAGDVVHDTAKIFLEMWNLYSREKGSLVIPKQDTNTLKGEIVIDTLSSYPQYRPNPIRREYVQAVRNARESIYIINLFLTDEELIEELINARKRGVDVNIISTFEPVKELKNFVSRITYDGYYYLMYHVKKLPDHGIKLYHYTVHQVHAKVGMVDDEWLTLGSSNLDYSSLRNASEINISFKYRPEIEKIKNDLFIKDIGNSSTLDGKSPFYKRFYYYLCYRFFMLGEKYFI